MAKGPTLTVTLMTDDKMSSGLSSATASVEGFGKKVSGFAIGAGAAITTMAVSAIPQLLDLGGQMVGLGQQAELFKTKSKTVFGSSSGDIGKWADSVNESFGLSDEAVVGLAASMGDLLVPMGFARDEAAKMTKETVGVAGALSAWSGGAYDTAEVTDILTKAMLGERDGLKALGISINQAEVDQRALEIATKDGRTAITEQDKALATQQLIFEKSADAQKAWADGSMDAVKNQNELKATIEDVKTSIGSALLPMVQKITAWFGDSFIPKVRELVATFQEKWPEIRTAIEPTLIWIQETVTAVVEFVQALWEQFGDRILTHAQNVWDYIREAVKSAMMIIKGVIDVVTGIISGDWAKVWDGIKAIAQGVWDGITNLIRFALRNIGLILDVAWENIKGAFFAVWSGLASYVDETWEKIKSGVANGVGAVVGFVAGLPWRIAVAVGDGFRAIWDNFKRYANYIVDGWNSLEFKMPSIDTHIPGVGKIGGWTVGTPNIPRFHGGGIIPGTPGSERLIIAQPGEGVFTPQQMSAMGPASAAPGIHIEQLTVNAGLGTNGAQVGRQIVDVLEAHYRNGGRPPRSG
jgi:hypothetical protein